MLLSSCAFRPAELASALSCVSDMMEDMDLGDAASQCPDIVAQMQEQTQSSAPTRKAKAKGTAKASGKAKSQPALKICFVLGCDETCVKGKRWCPRHNQVYDCLYYQAKKEGECAALEAAIRDPASACDVMNHFEEENPCDGKWRRKAIVNWSQFKRIFACSQTKRARSGTKPFEYGQWMLYGQNTMGWTKDQTQAEWQRLFKDPGTVRVHKGLLGAERCWISVIEESHHDKDTTRSSVYQEASNPDKNMSGDDREVLLNHVKTNLRDRDGAGFFQGGPADDDDDHEFHTPVKKEQKRPAEEELETPAEKKARVRLEKLSSGPQFTAFKTGISTKISEKLAGVCASATNAKTKLDAALVSTGQHVKDHGEDGVIASYIKCLQTSLAALASWDQDVPNAAGAKEDEVEKLKAGLQQSLSAVGADIKLVKGDAVLYPKGYFTWKAEDVKTCEHAKDVNDLQSQLMKTDFATAELFMKSLVKIAGDVGSCIKQKEKSLERAQAKKKKLLEQAEQDKVKEVAKSAAAKARMFTKQTHKIFGIKQNCWKPFLEHDAAGFDVNLHLEEPWVMRSTEQSKTWRNNADASVKLAEFGGAYRKAPSCKNDSRVMAPVLSKNGKEQAASLMAGVFPTNKKLDMSSMKDGQNFDNNMWYWGFDAKMSGGFLAPNAAAMVRVGAMGSVYVVAFDLARVMRNMCASGASNPSLQDVTEFIMGLEDCLQEGDDILGYAVTLNQDDVAYFPQGWFLAEQVVTTALTYGIKKSFLLDTPKAADSYNAATTLLKRSERDAGKMEEVAKLFSSCGASHSNDASTTASEPEKPTPEASEGATPAEETPAEKLGA